MGKKSYCLEEGGGWGTAEPQCRPHQETEGELRGHSCLMHMASDGTGAGSLLNSVLSTVLKKLPSDVWVVVPFLVTGDTAALDCI